MENKERANINEKIMQIVGLPNIKNGGGQPGIFNNIPKNSDVASGQIICDKKKKSVSSIWHGIIDTWKLEYDKDITLREYRAVIIKCGNGIIQKENNEIIIKKRYREADNQRKIPLKEKYNKNRTKK